MFPLTVSGETFPLEAPFFVLATQNPIEQEGTYPLPEAQLDRFMLELRVGYPTREEEERIVLETTGAEPQRVSCVIGHDELLALQSLVRRAHQPHRVRRERRRRGRTTSSRPS